MPDPVFNIVIGADAASSYVVVNGNNITKHLSGIDVQCTANQLTKVTLYVVPGQARVTVKAAVKDIKVV